MSDTIWKLKILGVSFLTQHGSFYFLFQIIENNRKIRKVSFLQNYKPFHLSIFYFFLMIHPIFSFLGGHKREVRTNNGPCITEP